MIRNIDIVIKRFKKIATDNRNEQHYWETRPNPNAGTLEYAQKACKRAEENEQLAELLEELAERREADRWISVKERLPDDLEPVNITWINHDPEPYYKEIKDKPFTATGVYFNGQWYWWSTLCTDTLAEYSHNFDDVIDADIEVIAWQPLPKPYESEATNETDNYYRLDNNKVQKI